jgi:probable rRNA maturation factor
VAPGVSIANRYRGLRVPAPALRRLFAVLAEARGELAAGAPSAGTARELSVAFLSDTDLARLHGRFLQDPTPTDVITFPPPPESESGGEICVSVDAARRIAGARGFSRELTLYLVHGWLHLAGHDDLEPGKKRRMRRAERRALAALASAGAMPRFTLAPFRR